MTDKGLEHPRPHQHQAIREKTISRRSAGEKIGKWIIGGAVLGTLGAAAVNRSQTERPKDQKPQPEAVPTQEREKLRRDKLNKILASRLDNPKRKDFEKDYANWAQNLDDINFGLLVVVDANIRIQLLEKRYALRNPENLNHKPLTPEQAAWADSENIYPETLAMAIGGREIALRILGEVLKDKGIEKFRPDIVDRITKGELGKGILDSLIGSPELMLLSAGGMARLVITESGFGLPKENGFWGKITGRDWIMYGFANIGSKPAIEMTIDAQAHPKKLNDEAVTFLADTLSKRTGLNFIPENIPGSEKDKNSSTGGAIGIQIMPGRAKDLYENLNKYFRPDDPLPHPLDPIGAIILAYLFIAQGVVLKGGYHNGYIRSPLPSNGRDVSTSINTGAINTWNNNPSQTSIILNSDASYIKNVPAV